MAHRCVTQRRKEGLRVFYLPWGVMIAPGLAWALPLGLQRNWALDVNYVPRLRPDGVWSFGSGTASAGDRVSRPKIGQSGFARGGAARRVRLGKWEAGL